MKCATNVVDFIEYRNSSPKALRKDFYNRLSAQNWNRLPSQEKMQLFKKFRGELLKILRLQSGIDIQEVAFILKKSPEELTSIEQGTSCLSDAAYFGLCSLYRSPQDAVLFLEKVDDALAGR